MHASNNRRIATIAFLIALEIILSRFLSIATPITKIGFSFLPLALGGMLFGPIWGGIIAVIADIMGATLFPIGVYFPGFTLTAFLTGAAYGMFFYRKSMGVLRIILCVLVIQLLFHLGLNTVWLWVITGKGYLAILPTRVLQTIVMIPIQVMGIYLAAKKLPHLFSFYPKH